MANNFNSTKFPKDLRILVYFLFTAGFLQLVFGVLLITGVGRTDGYTRRVLCGTVLLSTDTGWATYMFSGGLAQVVSAWGLIRKNMYDIRLESKDE